LRSNSCPCSLINSNPT
ncbi:hypothetical protein D046_8470B, partial [Vibrio parahaemolyticus V-223/04]